MQKSHRSFVSRSFLGQRNVSLILQLANIGLRCKVMPIWQIVRYFLISFLDICSLDSLVSPLHVRVKMRTTMDEMHFTECAAYRGYFMSARGYSQL